MYFILDKAWRIYYKNIIVHIFFSILFLALPYAMYLLAKSQAGYVASAIVVLLLSAAEVFFGIFPFYVSVARERISLLWKRLLRPATALALWWAPLVTALYIAMQFCIREEVLPTVVAFPLFSSGFSILFFIPIAFLKDYAVLYVGYVVLGVLTFFVYYSIYIGRYRIPKNILSLILFFIIQSVAVYAVIYGGAFCIGYFLYALGEEVIYTLAIVWSILGMLLTIPSNFALFKMFKDELSLKEAFGYFVDFYRNNFWKKIFIYVRVSLLLIVMLLLILVAMAALIWLCQSVPLLAIPFALLMVVFYLFIIPFVMIVPCEYFEECELY